MKENFYITGYFYEINEQKFRKYLNIKYKNSTVTEPDLMVIMMNPGSSQPVDGVTTDKETEVISDNTQAQIMAVMEQCGFKYARVLNLSDVCQPKSKQFYKTLEILEKDVISHSIFYDSRNNDFKKFFKYNVPVIYAWGVSRHLKVLAQLCVEKTNVKNPLGVKKDNYHLAYWHPMQRFKSNREKWVGDIVQQVKTLTLLFP